MHRHRQKVNTSAPSFSLPSCLIKSDGNMFIVWFAAAAVEKGKESDSRVSCSLVCPFKLARTWAKKLRVQEGTRRRAGRPNCSQQKVSCKPFLSLPLCMSIDVNILCTWKGGGEQRWGQKRLKSVCVCLEEILKMKKRKKRKKLATGYTHTHTHICACIYVIENLSLTLSSAITFFLLSHLKRQIESEWTFA